MATILTIDDTRLTHHVVRLALAHGGHTLASARDGVEGVEAASRLRPDLIILGRTLPAIDGVEVLRRARAANPHVRSIVIGVGLSEATQDACVELGATAFLERPIDAERLRRAIDAALTPRVSRHAA